MDNFDLKKYITSKVLLKENQDNTHNWDLIEDEMKWDLLLSAVKDPDEAELYIDKQWKDLPEEVKANIDWSIESDGQELDES